MKTLKNNLLIVTVLVCLSFGCSPSRIDFTNDDIDADFFKRVLKSEKEKRRIASGVKEVLVYKTTFEEVLIERDDIVEWTLISAGSSKETINYIQGFGNRVDLYLLELKAADGKNKGFIYYSLKLKKAPVAGELQDVCMGFGKAYYGSLTKPTVINLKDELKTGRHNKKYVLVKKSPATYLFVIDYNGGVSINVDKVVNTGYNKISGNKDLVYTVDEVFNEKKPMLFQFERTITIN